MQEKDCSVWNKHSWDKPNSSARIVIFRLKGVIYNEEGNKNEQNRNELWNRRNDEDYHTSEEEEDQYKDHQ